MSKILYDMCVLCTSDHSIFQREELFCPEEQTVCPDKLVYSNFLKQTVTYSFFVMFLFWWRWVWFTLLASWKTNFWNKKKCDILSLVATVLYPPLQLALYLCWTTNQYHLGTWSLLFSSTLCGAWSHNKFLVVVISVSKVSFFLFFFLYDWLGEIAIK